MAVFARWEQERLANGLTFLYRQSPGLPLAAGSLLIRTGSRYESVSQAGLASLTAELMPLGTRRRNARRIAEDVESVGAAIGVQASEDHTLIGYSAPAEHLGRILDGVGEIVTQPTFPPEEIVKERASTLASLQSRKDSLFNVAYDAFNQMMYGTHPYGRPLEGLEPAVKGFTRHDLKAWHQAHIQPERAVLAIVASRPFREISRQVKHAFGAWKKPAAVHESVVPELPMLPTAQRRVLKASFEQAFLMTGVSAPTVNDPDYVTLKVLNMLLGGGMSSRLFMRLREEMGLAYDVSAFFPTHILPSQWVIYLGTPREKLRVAKQALERLLDGLVRKAPTQQEVDQAIAMIKGAHVMEQQTRRRQAWYGAWWTFLGRRPDYSDAFLQEVGKVTPRRAHVLARKLLSQPRVTVEVIPKK